LIALSYSYGSFRTGLNDKSRRERVMLRVAKQGNDDRGMENDVGIAVDVRLGEVSNGDSIMLE